MEKDSVCLSLKFQVSECLDYEQYDCNMQKAINMSSENIRCRCYFKGFRKLDIDSTHFLLKIV